MVWRCPGLVLYVLGAITNLSCTTVPEEPGTDAGPGVQVLVTHGSEQQDVALASLIAIDRDGVVHVRLSDVVSAAFPALTLAEVNVDFVSSDGFMPGSREFCVGLVPVAGATLAKGSIAVETRNLAWDDDLQYPGCLSVNDTAEIQVLDP